MFQKNPTALIFTAIILGAVIIAGAIVFVGKGPDSGGILPTNSPSPSPSGSPASNYSEAVLETFAKCLTQKGAKFYGAWWCPHCQNQKALFSSAFQYVNYIECEKTPNVSQGDIVQACVDAKIQGYPTWIFADGTEKSGSLQLEALSQLTGCALK